MISRGAVRAFLNRKLKDYSKVKRLSDKRIDKELAKLPGPLPFEHWPKTPFRSQKDCFLIGTHEPYFPFFKSMGLGKSAIILALVEWRKSQDIPHKGLVFVPGPTHIDSWKLEAEEWSPDLNVIPLHGSSSERWDVVRNTNADLYILNYAGLTAMCTQKKKGKKKGMEIAWDRVQELASYFDGMVCDESHYVKNWKAKQSKICSGMAKSMDYIYCLTGTPTSRDPQDLWMQFYIVDGGKTLGYTLGMYRAAFFNTHKNRWGGYEHKFKKKMTSQLSRMINHGSITYRLEECHDIPKINRHRIRSPISEAGIEYYNQIAQELKDSKGDRQLIDNSFLRLRQLSSGFIGMKKEGKTKELELPECPKLEDLIDVVDDIDKDRKIVVFHWFTYSGRKICERLKKEKVKHVWLYGGTKNPGEVYTKFRDDEDVRVLVANSASGGEGLNLQVANYVLFYESPTSPIMRDQAEGRIRPHLQTNPIFYIDFVTKDTVDEQILSFIKEGRDLSEEILSDPKQIDLVDKIDD